MSISWADIKEAFFVIGSIAGVAALVRPLVDSKQAMDAKRVERILGMFKEQEVVDLAAQLESRRACPRLGVPASSVN